MHSVPIILLQASPLQASNKELNETRKKIIFQTFFSVIFKEISAVQKREIFVFGRKEVEENKLQTITYIFKSSSFVASRSGEL